MGEKLSFASSPGDRQQYLYLGQKEYQKYSKAKNK